ncbi:MAG: spore cortex-lytic enzyme [Clostridium sp.]|uniref:spore cortex-lytic enzyme n=1 Tax=Clostridium sp. (strain MSTE9) TaxID=1105031 RepID=UPI00026F1B32|nr:spore cortex-lytic enzyme [Clostridium sp. MSTE9]EJF39287.1 spore cortex-lytic enzyme [Clostridium sp. MSTE9]MBS5783960.1 spore cortex-lytic enzyme [Clostridium sp.]
MKHAQKREYKEFGKYIWRIMMILLVNLLMISIVSGVGEQAVIRLRGGTSVETLSRVGSRGDEVKQIQTKLKNWGYYKGNVDGIFGEQTKQAVISFQKKNNLTADGVAGPQTLKAMGISSSSSSSGGSGGGQGQYSSGDVDLLARVISAESRGEPYAGQVAVGAVILNRISHPSFPNTLAGVIYQPGAFSCLNDGGINAPVADSAYKAARDAINGSDPSGGAIYYYNPEKSTSKWIFSRKVITTIGKHRFAI